MNASRPRSAFRARRTRTQVCFALGLAAASFAFVACSAAPGNDATESTSEELSMMSISPFNVRTAEGEESGRGPMVVTIRAQGLTRLNQSARVTFGNAQAVMTPKQVAPDGSWITVSVPPLATSGQVTVAQAGRTYTVTPGLSVNQWRNVNGYSFSNSTALQNMVGGYSFQDMVDAFGTNGTILGCWTVAGTTVCAHDPTADVLLGIANASLQNGQCFGFANSSLRFQHGQKSLSNFPAWNGANIAMGVPPGPRDIWHLRGPGNDGTPGGNPKDPSQVPSELSHFIHLSHLQQMSSEFLSAWVANSNPTGDKNTFRNQVHNAIGTGGGPAGLISLAGCSHVVQPYWVEDISNGAFNVFVYDPNLPALAEQGPNGQPLQGEATADRKLKSVIHVSAGGQYTFNDGDGGESCSGGLDQLRAFPASVVPTNPTVPSLTSGLDAIVHAIAGSAVGVSQIHDAQGKMLLDGAGAENRDARTRMPNSGVFTPLGGLGHADPIYLLNGSGPYTLAISGKASGAYTLAFVNKDFTVKLEDVPSQAGGQDELTVDRAGASVELKTSSQAKPVKLQAIAHARDGIARTAVLSTSSSANGSIRLAFDDARDGVTYTHHGAPTTFSVELSSAGASGTSTRFASQAVRVETGDVITLRPAWQHLESGVQMHVTNASGAETVQSLR